MVHFTVHQNKIIGRYTVGMVRANPKLANIKIKNEQEILLSAAFIIIIPEVIFFVPLQETATYSQMLPQSIFFSFNYSTLKILFRYSCTCLTMRFSSLVDKEKKASLSYNTVRRAKLKEVKFSGNKQIRYMLNLSVRCILGKDCICILTGFAFRS